LPIVSFDAILSTFRFFKSQNPEFSRPLGLTTNMFILR
jgi:hypothetical protein